MNATGSNSPNSLHQLKLLPKYKKKKWQKSQSSSPLISQVGAINRGSFRHIVGGDGVIRPPQQHIRRQLATHNRNVRRQVHPKHTQAHHRSSPSAPPPPPQLHRATTTDLSIPLQPGGSAITVAPNPPAFPRIRIPPQITNQRTTNCSK